MTIGREVPVAGDQDGGRRPPRDGRVRSRRPRHLGWYILLLVECLVVLIPSIYVREAPKAWGIPFFFWFQLAWIFVSMAVTGIVYAVTTPREPRQPAPRNDGGQ